MRFWCTSMPSGEDVERETQRDFAADGAELRMAAHAQFQELCRDRRAGQAASSGHECEFRRCDLAIPDAISIPAKALFTDQGKPIVYVKTDTATSWQSCQLYARGIRTTSPVEGIQEGTPVALVEPPKERKEAVKRRSAIGVCADGVGSGGISAAVCGFRKDVSRRLPPARPPRSPLTKVKRDDITLERCRAGSLRGGNSEMLTAPLTGGGEMHIT